ncbi:MAG: hypothetical protein R3B91_13675 [Planctomycetaceae bacterium]
MTNGASSAGLPDASQLLSFNFDDNNAPARILFVTGRLAEPLVQALWKTQRIATLIDVVCL